MTRPFGARPGQTGDAGRPNWHTVDPAYSERAPRMVASGRSEKRPDVAGRSSRSLLAALTLPGRWAARAIRRQVTAAVDLRLAAIAARQDAMATRLDAMATRLDAVAAQFGMALGPLARCVPLGDDVLLRSPHGWLLLPAEDLRVLAAMLETGGSLEPGTTRTLQALLSPGDLAVDVGANVGALSIAMARSVGPCGRIVAVEPMPRLAALLRRTAYLNSLQDVILIENCAVGAHNGTGRLSMEGTTAHNSLLPLPNATGHLEVPIRCLDNLMAADAQPALIKIDVEGAELDVWRGMRGIIAGAAHLAVVVEFGPSHLSRSGIGVDDWIGNFTSAGFTPWEIDEGSGFIKPLRTQGLEAVASINLLLLRDPPSRWPNLLVAE